MIYVAGDLHGPIETNKLGSANFPHNDKLTKDDYVIIAGDFGLIWDGSNEEKYWHKWLENKNFTTLFVDGNHENFDTLQQFPIEMWNGGKIQRITNSIIHLMRGQVYTIDGKKIFTFGGATSIDKIWRTEHVSWWQQEMPITEEYEEGLLNLEKHEWKVDYIITHTCSTATLNVLSKLYDFDPEGDSLTKYFELLSNKVKYKYWYFGHFHQDLNVLESQTVVYNKIHEL